MRNEIKKTLSLGALCTMAFFAASSAFAASGADQVYGGDYTNAGDYSYDNWTSTTEYDYANPYTATWANITIGAGSDYTYATATKTLTIEDGLYLYGKKGDLATFTQSAANTITVNGDLSMVYSTFNMSAGVLDIYGTTTLNESASFVKTAGTLTFRVGSSIVINGGTLKSDSTTLFGKEGLISLTLDSVTLSGDTAKAYILGSIDLGTATFGDTAAWTIELDVSSILDSYATDFTINLSDLITFSDDSVGTASQLSIILLDSEGNLYDDYTASLSGDNLSSATVSFAYAGAAVPEPSTYAMIFGVVALGFAAYRRRK